MKFIKKKYKGSMTLEAAFIVPMMTCIIILVIFLSILLYSRCYAQIAISNSIARASSSWYGVEDEMALSSKKDVNGSPAWGYVLSEINSTVMVNEKIKKLENDIVKRIKNGSPMKVDVKIESERNWGVFSENINIKVKCRYKLPMKGIFGIFQVGDEDGYIVEEIERNVNVASGEHQMRAFSFTKKKLIQFTEMYIGEASTTKFKEVIGVVKDGFSKFVQ